MKETVFRKKYKILKEEYDNLLNGIIEDLEDLDEKTFDDIAYDITLEIRKLQEKWKQRLES